MLTRRSFLQLLGATVAATTLKPLTQLMAFNDESYQGRALTSLAVYTTPGKAQPSVGWLWSDSIVPILDQRDDWYQIPDGWVRREAVQPMMPYDPQAYVFNRMVPFWAEVAAPVATIRQYCAADAPLITRVGHGGVMQVIDALPGEPNGWYGVADQDGVLLGWTQGVFWRPIEFEAAVGEGRGLRFDRSTMLMSAFEGDDLVINVPFSSVMDLTTGLFEIRRGVIGGENSAGYQGVSWQTLFGDGQAIAGIYWHNQFGRTVDYGPAIQLTPLVARWVYEWLGDDGHIVVE